MVPPLLKDWSEFDRLRFDPEHPWWRRYLRQLEVFVDASRGRWGISHFILTKLSQISRCSNSET
jgi:hypothetical protein